MDHEAQRNLHIFAKDLGRESLDLWRESLSTLRQLHNDLWNGVRFFTTVNGILLAGVFGLSRTGISPWAAGWLTVCLSLIGAFLTVTGHYILTRHREYYVNMLLRKSLIEEELGLYERRLGSVDMSFPWSVPAEFLHRLRSDPGGWIQEQLSRKGTISGKLFNIYRGTIAVWGLRFLAGRTQSWWRDRFELTGGHH